jgi:hypothetical protein
VGFENLTEYLKKLSDSMPKRLELVYKYKGEMTKF